MSWISFRRVQIATPLLAVAVAGCSGCGDEPESRRIDLGLRPDSEHAATPAGGADAEPAGDDRPAPAESADAAVPAAAETADAETAEQPAAVPADPASEPVPAPSSARATGVGAPP